MKTRQTVLFLGLLAAIFSCLTFISGCKSPREKFEAAARANLELLPGLAEPARNAPPADEATEKNLANIKGIKLEYLNTNALLIHLEELENPTLRHELPLRINNRSPNVDLAQALGLVKQEPGTKLETAYNPGLDVESNMNSVWQRMGELRFVLVVRTLNLKDAELAGNKTFFTGTWKGEILVFELADKKLLGGFTVDGINHANVKTTVGRDRENLAADLKLTTRGNMVARIRELFPGVGPKDEPN